MSIARTPRNPAPSGSSSLVRRRSSPDDSDADPESTELPSNVPPRKRARLGHSPSPDHVPAIPEGALGPPHGGLVMPTLVHGPLVSATDAAPSPASSEVEIVEPPTVTMSVSPPTRRSRRPAASRSSAVTRAKPRAKTAPKGKANRREKTPEAPVANFVPVRSPEELLPSVTRDVPFETALPAIDSPPYPCLQCAFHGYPDCEFQGWEHVCQRCKTRHLKCSFVQKNNDDLYYVRERLWDQVRGSPSGPYKSFSV